MYTDLFGKKRFKVNLHMHTKRSDGFCTPEEAVTHYAAEGYDAVALTDHWIVGKNERQNGVLILPGVEYDTRTFDCRKGVFHILGIGMKREPAVQKYDPAQKIIDDIHSAGGFVVLAHPAWSLNTPAQITSLCGVDATEIYNTVSGVHESRRPDSSLIVDMLATDGHILPLIAADDAHYYDNDACKSWIMVEAEDCTEESLMDAIRNGRYYATQGPEVHIRREGDEIVVNCSPVSEAIFHSNLAWVERVHSGDSLKEVRHPIGKKECFVRAEVVDKDGKHAWSRIIATE